MMDYEDEDWFDAVGKGDSTNRNDGKVMLYYLRETSVYRKQ